jgi:hypothetical protein
MKKNTFALIVLSVLALAFAGCRSTGEYKALSNGVEESVECVNLEHARLPDGRLQVAAILHNLENRRIQVQVNCDFEDEHGVVIDSTPFENVILTENAREDVKFVSMNDKAERFFVRVREAR